MNNTGLGALVSTTKQISTAAHGALNIALIAPRAAFLGLIRLNIWGLAKLLSRKAFLVDAATTATQKAPNMWWDVQAKWRNAWWNLGGNWDSFINAVNAGKSKKALGFKLAPASVKAKLKAQGIGSYTALGSLDEQSIGAISEATIATAAAIIAALKPILDMLFDNAKKDLPPSDLEEFEDPKTGANTTGSSSMAGAGLIGVAALAAIYFGTMSKK
tara:strand:- start:1660 stop:2307 length:648 start_codon:yes stop_codon:yes gene_type:complete